MEALYKRATRYRAGVVGVEFLTGGAPTGDIIEYPDGSMAFNPTIGWGKDGLAILHPLSLGPGASLQSCRLRHHAGH